MMFIELFVPRGTLREDRRQAIVERLVTEVMHHDSAPAAVIEAGQAISQVVVHEPDSWIVGGQAVEAGDPPRYVVRVTVPAAWRKEMSRDLIERVTRVLAETEDNPERLYRQQPQAWVHVVGVPEGGCGAFGRVLRSADLVKLVTQPFRDDPDAQAAASAAGTAIDPICGMTVDFADPAITLERGGATYAFCSSGCRQVFAEEAPS